MLRLSAHFAAMLWLCQCWVLSAAIAIAAIAQRAQVKLSDCKPVQCFSVQCLGAVCVAGRAQPQHESLTALRLSRCTSMRRSRLISPWACFASALQAASKVPPESRKGRYSRRPATSPADLDASSQPGRCDKLSRQSLAKALLSAQIDRRSNARLRYQGGYKVYKPASASLIRN